MASSVRNHLRGNVIGYIALFVALGGTAYAAGTGSIGSRELADQSVGSKEIKQSSVKTQDLSAGLTDDIDDDGCGWVGGILRVGFGYAPTGTFAASGQTLPIALYQELFQLYGTTYGGDGQETFRLPDLNNGNAIEYVVCMEGVYPAQP